MTALYEPGVAPRQILDFAMAKVRPKSESKKPQSGAYADSYMQQ